MSPQTIVLALDDGDLCTIALNIVEINAQVDWTLAKEPLQDGISSWGRGGGRD